MKRPGLTNASVPFSSAALEQTVPERFEKIVRMYPDRIAVKTGNEAVTYSQLDAMVDRMAHAIVDRRGTEAEAVAILMDKGARLMASMLAVLKAGKFFVWMDGSTPNARLAAVLEDSQASLIISEQKYGEVTRHLITRSNSSLLEFDSTAPRAAEANLSLGISPISIATVRYTSGSTGKPKGVVWTHRNLLHQAMLFTNAYELSEADRLLLTTSGTANALTVAFLALLTGAALFPFDVQIHGVNRLIQWLRDEKISICWLSSPLFRNLCHALPSEEKFSDVRVVRLASEASYKSDIDLYKQHFSADCRLINGLSNTESGAICLYPIDLRKETSGQEVPVGYPLEDKEVLLLDDDGNEVGPNEVGEIAVRSRYLSPGYWRRPELTANKFKTDPNGGDKRMYLSGDLGLMRPDGCLIHKGRKDSRVKIRGYGVEIAEIEKILNTHRAVGQAVVVARKRETGEARLVAYYTRTELPAPTVSELRGFLKNQLPDFMIPSSFVMLEAMPLTHGGKIDRRALPEPDNVRPTLATAYLSSRNEIEQELIAIWQDALDVRPVGVNDGFFDLGGDSLSASRVLSQVIKHFQLEIPLQLLFQSPTIAELAAVIAQRRSAMSGNAKQDHLDSSPLVPVSRERLLPLSYSQQRLWFLDQLHPGSFTYNLASAYRLKGELNVAALEQSFNEILRRHEILRTVFKSEDGNPAQVVLPTLAITIPIFDLRATVSAEDQWTEVHRMFREEAQRPFDLSAGPLLRITLLQLAEHEYVLLRAVHHIVYDGWSEGVLFHELAEIYGALSKGKPSPLADLPVQYADYAVWQRQWLLGERLESQLSYWKKHLENIATLQLPADRPRRAIQTSRGVRHHFALSHALSAELRELSAQHGVTLFMTLLAAFQTLLHRYSGQTDIVIGSPAAGRSRREFEKLIGFFLNTLVLRVDLSGNPTFAEAIRRVREVCLGALSHQELPFEKLVEELHPDRNPGLNPLFQVNFAFQNTPRVSPQLSAIEVDELAVETGIARFDLHLFMEEMDGQLKGYCDSDTNLFHARTIEGLLGHLKTLLEGVVENPNQRIADLPILTEAEKHQLLVQWNDTKRDYRSNQTVQKMFEDEVHRAPEAVAVVFEDQRLTYRELNHKANQLAHYLRKRGVRPETLVAVCMERSVEMVIGILGVLKAGGAYVPIDPDSSANRLKFMLQDTQTPLILTQERFRSLLAEYGDRRVCIDSAGDELSLEVKENPQNQVDDQNAAYMIYTSGSTGTPKGVLNVHGGLRNRLQWMQETYRLTPADRVLQKTPFTFDVSVWEFFWPLISGARLVLARPGCHRDSEYLVQLIQSQQITTLHFVPSMLGVFLLEGEVENCTSLRQVFCSGEALTYESQQQFFAATDAALHNLYGPTEASIDVTAWECRRDSDRRIVSIGRPIANTQIYILDRQLRPVPIGVAGELHIGGAGLARGYLNGLELTGEKFIANPFTADPTSRLYKTGDFARYLPDGNIEFLGRMDNQVKIRGYRIELGEIEAVLGRHPAIQSAVVAVREDAPGDKRLVGYVVARPEDSFDVAEARKYLKQKLPEYMVPSAFVLLDELPLTPSGKVDRNALPAPDRDRSELGCVYHAPRTPVEETIASIWCELLKLSKVGIHDNFFELGGHSLLATQVISRLSTAFNHEIPLRSIFECPTIETLGAMIVEAQASSAAAQDIPLVDSRTGMVYER
jgi:amino acid adenylation domain-containing protein